MFLWKKVDFHLLSSLLQKNVPLMITKFPAILITRNCMFYKSYGTLTNDLVVDNVYSEVKYVYNYAKKNVCQLHPVFPSGHPSKY